MLSHFWIVHSLFAEYYRPLLKWFVVVTPWIILLVITWAGVGYGLYLVEELIHGEAAGRNMYDISETRYNPNLTTQRT